MAYQQPAWAQQPMPAGWEAKFDPGQKRYFFINHSTRQTTWVDPRQSMWERQQQHQQQAAAAARPHHAGQQRDNQYETAFQPQPSPSFQRTHLAKLHAEFPSADMDIVKDVLTSCHGDEDQARAQLKSLGYAHAQAGGSRSREVSPRRTPSKTTSSSSPRPKAQAPTGPSDAHKAKLKEKMAKEFPGCSASVVEMALEASHYEEAKTRMLLQSMGGGGSRASPSKSTPKKTTGQTSSSSTSSTTGMTSTSSTPYKFPDTNFNVPSIFDKTTPSSSASGVAITITPSGTSTGATTSDANKPSPTKRKAHKNRNTAKGTNKSSSARSNAANSSKEYRSENRIQAKGPDPSLAKGPNLDHILDTYVVARGPNPANRQGALGGKGRDPSLVSGPNRSLVCGSSYQYQEDSSIHSGHQDYRGLITAL